MHIGEKTVGAISYIGETSRPWRDRVHEHMLCLRRGSPKSFITAHWMEAHTLSLEAPEFKWEVVDSYPDALIRQVTEGLYILETGVLNKRQEFQQNIICRMSAEEMTEDDLKCELAKKKKYK